MATMKVLRCGAFGSIQDLGRTGLRHLGIPLSGALDESAAKNANLLCGNDENMALLELIGPGWEFEFSENTQIAICGADWKPQINQQHTETNRVCQIKSGDKLFLKNPGSGRIAYLGISGGFHSEEILGSRSWHPQLNKTFLLRKNMLLTYSARVNSGLSQSIITINNLPDTARNSIVVQAGPEWDLLSPDAIIQLTEMKWSIDNRSNRMAYFIKEKFVPANQSILSSAVWPGIVQLTPSAQMIILMKDAQTTGGYPRILSISQNELNKVAQKNPGETFRLKFTAST